MCRLLIDFKTPRNFLAKRGADGKAARDDGTIVPCLEGFRTLSDTEANSAYEALKSS